MKEKTGENALLKTVIWEFGWKRRRHRRRRRRRRREEAWQRKDSEMFVLILVYKIEGNYYINSQMIYNNVLYIVCNKQRMMHLNKPHLIQLHNRLCYLNRKREKDRKRENDYEIADEMKWNNQLNVDA